MPKAKPVSLLPLMSMKRLKPSLTSILIGLALLLSAAASVKGANYTRTNQISPHSSRDQTASNTYNYYYPNPTGPLATAGNIASIVSAVLLTLFTGGLWLTSHRQWQIATEALILANRPRIKVRTFYMAIWQADNTATVQFHIVNYGGSTAYFVETNCNIVVRENTPMGLPTQPQQLQSVAGDDRIVRPGTSLESGHSRPAVYSPDTLFTRDDYESVAKDMDRLYVLGYIIYRDSHDHAYRTAFARWFSVPDQEFKRVEKPDYDYED
jgi:hypothetical protein